MGAQLIFPRGGLMQNVVKPSRIVGRKLILTLEKCPNSLSELAALPKSSQKE